MWYVVWRVAFVVTGIVMAVGAWVYGAWHWRSCLDGGLQGSCAAYQVVTSCIITCILGISSLRYLLRQVGRIEIVKCNEQEDAGEIEPANKTMDETTRL